MSVLNTANVMHIADQPLVLVARGCGLKIRVGVPLEESTYLFDVFIL